MKVPTEDKTVGIFLFGAKYVVFCKKEGLWKKKP